MQISAETDHEEVNTCDNYRHREWKVNQILAFVRVSSYRLGILAGGRGWGGGGESSRGDMASTVPINYVIHAIYTHLPCTPHVASAKIIA